MNSYFSEDIPEVVIKSLFTKYDTDEDGHLSTSEVRQFLSNDLGMKPDEVKAVALLMDKDADHEISFLEFAHWVRNAGHVIKDNSKYFLLKRAAEYFMKVDKDNNRTLDEAEVKNLIVALGARIELLEEQFQAMDKDGNGRITFDEFLRWLNWLPMEEWIYEDIEGQEDEVDKSELLEDEYWC